jgi:tripartite-type tricarboxylate transporter receptor subunit TctC
MKLPRRAFLHLAASAAALPAVSRVARAQAYPARPVRIVVGFPAGLGPDITARLIAQLLSERFGQSFIVDNRPGAGSNIGTEIVVRAPADGYTLLLMTASNAINATVYDNLNFDFIRDVAPVASVGVVPFLMVVNSSFPAQTISEFIAYAKAHPAKINMGSAGYGSAPHVFGELFKMMTGIDLVHIPYRDSYWPDLVAGQTQILFAPVTSATGYPVGSVARACGHHANASRGNAGYPCARRICAGL